MCRWVNVLLTGAYLFLTVGVFVVILVVFGFRLSNSVRWGIVFGWAGGCFATVWLKERLLTVLRPRFRPPILSEEARLDAAMGEVLSRVRCLFRVRFLIDSDPAGHDRSLGFRTIAVLSGSLLWASDSELRSMMAYELFWLRDGSRVLTEVCRVANPPASAFRKLCLFVRKRFRVSWLPGLVLTVPIGMALLVLLPFFLLEKAFDLAFWSLGYWQVLRADAYVFELGYGDGWRAWLEKSSLGVHASRIRRLEKMAGLRE